MNPVKIGQQIAKRLLAEEITERVSIYPGAFKPPHKGHVGAALSSIDDKTDKVIIFMSSKDREDVSVDEAQKVWDLYKASVPGLDKVEIIQTPTPVKAVYDYAKDNPTHDIRAVFGKGEQERFGSLLDKEKYPHVEVFDSGTVGSFSATDLRKAIRDNNIEKVKEFLPDGININDFLAIFQNKETLQEIGEANVSPYKWKEKKRTDYSLSYEFTTDSGVDYLVLFTEDEDEEEFSSLESIKSWDISFFVKSEPDEDGDTSYSSSRVVNKGELFKVMSTITDITKNLIKSFPNTEKITFQPSASKGDKTVDNQRGRLYKAFVSKQLPQAKIDQEGTTVIVNLPEKTSLKENYILQNLESQYGIDLDLFDGGKYLVLSRISIPKEKRGQGLGSKIMNQIIQYADKVNKPIYLTPTKDFGATSIGRLEQFYKQFGFKKKDKSDFSARETMIRMPKQSLNESWHPNKARIINKFIDYATDYLSIDRPTIKLINTPDYTQHNHSFGGYMPSEKKLMVVVHNRNMADILRTLAHELVHHMQNLDNRLQPDSGEDGSPEENEANSLAAVLMRKFGRENPEIYE